MSFTGLVVKGETPRKTALGLRPARVSGLKSVGKNFDEKDSVRVMMCEMAPTAALKR